MRNLTKDNVTQAFIDLIADDAEPRAREIITSLVNHLHDFAREVKLTPDELVWGARFLQRIGQISDERREEGILMSDTLGATMLVDAMAHSTHTGATETSVLGPFWRDGAPEATTRADISVGNEGEKTIVYGRVATRDGKPVEGAVLDIWQTAPNGLYENVDDTQPDMNLRVKLTTAADGAYELTTVKPCSYEIPTDGPVGEMLRALGRHSWRPAHIHFIVTADGFAPVTTALFDEEDDYIDADSVFGVKDSLVIHYDRHDSKDEAKARGVEAPFYTVNYDFSLVPA